MYLAAAQDPRTFAPMVKNVMHTYRFLVIWRDLPFPNPDAVFYLYGSDKSEASSLEEAITAHPFGELVQRLEYLPPQEIERLRQLQEDPLAGAFERLGLVKK